MMPAGLGRKKRRLVEVFPGLLKYYKDQCKAKPVLVDLKADTAVSLVKGGKGVFTVTAQKEQLQFICISDEEAKEWVEVVQGARVAS